MAAIQVVPPLDHATLAQARPPSPPHIDHQARAAHRGARSVGSAGEGRTVGTRLAPPPGARGNTLPRGRSAALVDTAPALEGRSARCATPPHGAAHRSRSGSASARSDPRDSINKADTPHGSFASRKHGRSGYSFTPPHATGSQSASVRASGRAHRQMRLSLQSLAASSDPREASSMQSSGSGAAAARPLPRPGAGHRVTMTRFPRQPPRPTTMVESGPSGDEAPLGPYPGVTTGATRVWGVKLRSPSPRPAALAQPVPVGEARSASDSSEASSEGFAAFARAAHVPCQGRAVDGGAAPVAEGHDSTLTRAQRRSAEAGSPPSEASAPPVRGILTPPRRRQPPRGAMVRPSVALRLPGAQRASGEGPSARSSATLAHAPPSPPSGGSSASINMPASSYDGRSLETALAPNNVYDAELQTALAGAAGGYAVLHPTDEPETDEGTVYTLTHAGVTRRVVLTGDMDDDIDIIADLEAELGVPVSVAGLGADGEPTAVTTMTYVPAPGGNPLPGDDDSSDQTVEAGAGGAEGASRRSAVTDEIAASPAVLLRQARRDAAGLARPADSATGASGSAASTFHFQHSAESPYAPANSSGVLPWPGGPAFDPTYGMPPPSANSVSVAMSRDATPLSATVLRGIGPAPAVPKLSLSSVDVLALRASAEAQSEAVQDESLLIDGRASVGGVGAGAGKTTGSVLPPARGPLSTFEGSAIHAQRGASFKSQAAFLQHMRAQQADAAGGAHERWADVESMRAEAARGAADAAAAAAGAREFDYDAEASARLIYRSPALHVAFLTLVMNLLLTEVCVVSACCQQC
jgi:hypothetical protein